MQPLISQGSDLRSGSSFPSLHKRSHSFAGDVRKFCDIVEESFMMGEAVSMSPPSIRKAVSDPVRASLASMAIRARPSPIPHEKISSYELYSQQDVSIRGLVRKFFADHQGNSFIKKVEGIVASHLFNYTRENISYPEVVCLTKRALEIHMQFYREKYGIHIQLATVNQLPSLLDAAQKSCVSSRYLSFIVGQVDEDLEDGHVLPLLCFLRRGKVEALIMDVLGSLSDCSCEVSEIVSRYTDKENIYVAAGIRQADSFSCRTGALTLLRNAHLSLQYHHCEEGLRASLERLVSEPFDPECCLLPSEWTYGEQIFHGTGDAFVLRDRLSKRVHKKANPRTVESFRREFTEKVRFRCCFSRAEDYRNVFQGLSPPDGVEAVIRQDFFRMQFDILVDVNTYLLHKGFQRAGLGKRMPKVE